MRTNNMTHETNEDFIVKLSRNFDPAPFFCCCWPRSSRFGVSSSAQELKPKKFSSPGEASDALFQAAQKQDQPALEAISEQERRSVVGR